MGATSVHPSQRRISCEACRKHKARCQRFNQDDPKCARCTLLDLACTSGQQKNIGRPRRAAASVTPSKPTVKKPTANTSLRVVPPWVPQDNALPSTDTVDWTSLMSSASTPVQDTAAVEIDAFSSAWPTMEINSFVQSSNPWDTFLGFADAGFIPSHDSAFGALAPSSDVPPFYLTQSPPSTPSSDHGACLAEVHSLEISGGPKKEDCIDVSIALSELSRMNIDLHIRVAAADTHKAVLKFDNLVQREGPLYIEDITMVEFVTKTSLRLLQIVTRLLSNRQNIDSPAENTLPLETQPIKPNSQQISQADAFSCSPPIALLITSIFTQLISLHELVLGYIITRVERISVDPLPSMTGVLFNDLPLENSCAQGMLFCQAVIYLLGRTETALGINSKSNPSQEGLLSARQIKVLWGELDSRRPIIPNHGLMRPSTLRRLFGKVAGIFKQMLGDSSYS
ncbi:Ff.00g064020.m01.CDS01 [Fusarium sp. VM40]|nr:Ff.00g064020.m01.CDS01 [Fusarium sp. VM40]